MISAVVGRGAQTGGPSSGQTGLVFARLFCADAERATQDAKTTTRAVRDTESRTRFLGYRPETYKLFVFVLSAVMCGIGGALYVPQVGIINPSEFSPANSIEAVIWVAVGGRGTLVGPILGAVLVVFLTEGTRFLSGALAVLSPVQIAAVREALIGGALILVLYVRPQGILPEVTRMQSLETT